MSTTTSRIVQSGSRRLVGIQRLIVLVSGALVVLLLINQLQFYGAYKRFATEDLVLTRLAGRIVHLDEVLTMSARIAAKTGDAFWVQRYRHHEPQLNEVLSEALTIAPNAEREHLLMVDVANRALIDRETRALERVEAGDNDAAISLVFGDEYDTLKQDYRAGVDGLLEHFDRRVASSMASAKRWAFVGGAVALLAICGALVMLWLSVERSHRETQLFNELAASERRSTLGRLAASLAHELNQPLAAIVNYTGAAKSYCCDASKMEEICAAVDGASAQAERAGEIVRRMREFSRPSTPIKETIDPQQAIRASVQLVSGQSRAARVCVEHNDDEFAPLIRADRVQLQQVLINLLVNAIEASKEGGVVRVSARQDNGCAVIEVRDNGVGISKSESDRIFDAFYTTKQEGQGLGLAVSRDIVEGHGGVIEVDARGPGAAFIVRIPEVDQ